MLEYDRTAVFKKIDVNKTNGLWDCFICHYRYFLEINFRSDPKICNCCHDLMQKVAEMI